MNEHLTLTYGVMPVFHILFVTSAKFWVKYKSQFLTNLHNFSIIIQFDFCVVFMKTEEYSITEIGLSTLC